MTGTVMGTDVSEVPEWIEQRAANVAADFEAGDSLWEKVTQDCEDFIAAWIGRPLALMVSYGLAFKSCRGIGYEESAIVCFKNEVYDRAKEILADDYGIHLD